MASEEILVCIGEDGKECGVELLVLVRGKIRRCNVTCSSVNDEAWCYFLFGGGGPVFHFGRLDLLSNEFCNIVLHLEIKKEESDVVLGAWSSDKDYRYRRRARVSLSFCRLLPTYITTSSTASRRAKIMFNKKKVELCELMLHVTQVPMVYDVVGKLGEGDSNVYNVCSYVFTDLLFEEYC